MAYTAKQRTFRKRETKEKFAARKKAEKDAAYEMIDNSITEMMNNAEKFIDYLDFQSSMDRYTVANTLLIKAQYPQATQLKSADIWNELNAKINKGEKEIHIFEPTDYIDENGEQRTSCNIKYVFDVSQTDADPKDTHIVEYNPQALVKAMVNAASLKKVAVDELPITDSTAYYDAKNNTLLIKRKSDSVSLFKDISRELSLAEIAKGCDEYNRDECMPSALCASYMLCQKYGISNKNVNVEIAPKEWAGLENKDIRTKLTMANDALYSIGRDIYIQMQKNKEKAEKEPAR